MYNEKAHKSTYIKKNISIKVCSFLDHSYTILSSFKIVVIFDSTSADVVLISTNVILETILKELRIAKLCSKNERTLGIESY